MEIRFLRSILCIFEDDFFVMRKVRRIRSVREHLFLESPSIDFCMSLDLKRGPISAQDGVGWVVHVSLDDFEPIFAESEREFIGPK